MRFAGMMRVKNEARWIERAIRSLLPLCSEVYILDDHSSDATAEIANSFDQTVVFDSPSAPGTLNETGDKKWLLDQIVRTQQPYDYIVCIDGDEELEPAGQEKIRKVCHYGKIVCASFRIVYLWDEPYQYRSDGIYAHFQRQSLFKYNPRDTTFRSVYGLETGLHCSNVPSSVTEMSLTTDIMLMHWGYYDRDLRLRKYKFYNEVDPNNVMEDGYRHMVIGDLFPSESRFRHGGPLRLEALNTLDAAFATR
jgi:glycosyltransferase involved in cell wall biosynthesis